MPWPIVSLVVFVAVFVQSLVGFGSAMVAMALLGAGLGLAIASPLVALTSLTLEIGYLARRAAALNLGAVWRLIAGALAGVPLGMLALRRVPDHVLLPALGLVIGAYALYGLWGGRLPQLQHPAWGYGAGLLAGVLGGAYNTSGPPAIVYGDCRRWAPPEFKSNLQAFFLVADGLVVLGHTAAGNVTPTTLTYYALAVPAILFGLWLGFRLERRLAPAAFRRLALLLLLALGLRLIWTAL
jgi:uncharacterized membrane protein YfcA